MIGIPFGIVIVLQIICVIHILRNHKPYWWIYLIIFVPIVGCVVYLFMEVLSGDKLADVGEGIANAVAPTRKIRKLQDQLKFAPTFRNQLLLADAFLENGMYLEAVEQFREALKGAFSTDLHGNVQLARAYIGLGQYDEALKVLERLDSAGDLREWDHLLLLAQSLDAENRPAEAIKVYRKSLAKRSELQTRYELALLLRREAQPEEAQKLLQEILAQEPYVSKARAKESRQWISLAREALKS